MGALHAWSKWCYYLNTGLIGVMMLGQRCGMLVVIEMLGKSRVRCQCDCGNTRNLRLGHFNIGSSKSCGCHWRLPSSLQHVDKERSAYSNMMARCHNPMHKRYKDYGAVGILVCDEWRGDSRQFLQDMGVCPDGFQLDRADNTKGYSKENCRWVSPRDNMANRAISTRYVVKGVEYKNAHEAASAYKVSITTINVWCKGRILKGLYSQPKSNCYVVPVYGGKPLAIPLAQ